MNILSFIKFGTVFSEVIRTVTRRLEGGWKVLHRVTADVETYPDKWFFLTLSYLIHLDKC